MSQLDTPALHFSPLYYYRRERKTKRRGRAIIRAVFGAVNERPKWADKSFESAALYSCVEASLVLLPPLSTSVRQPMEQAIEEAVQLHRWDLWTLVPASRPAPPYTNDQRHRVLIALKAFAHLWLGHNGNPAFLVALGPSPPKHPPSVASIARRGVYYVDRSLRDIAHASMHDVVDRQIERLWNGTMLDKDAIPFKALLDDSWRTNSFNMRLRVDCCRFGLALGCFGCLRHALHSSNDDSIENSGRSSAIGSSADLGTRRGLADDGEVCHRLAFAHQRRIIKLGQVADARGEWGTSRSTEEACAEPEFPEPKIG